MEAEIFEYNGNLIMLVSSDIPITIENYAISEQLA